MKSSVPYAALALAPALLPIDALARNASDVTGSVPPVVADADVMAVNRPADRSPRSGEARVAIILDIDEAGAVTRCQVAQSSGYPQLDSLTCDTMAKTARFHPAHNKDGEAIASQYRTIVTFRL